MEQIEFRIDKEFNIAFAVFIGNEKTIGQDIEDNGQEVELLKQYNNETVLIYTYTQVGKHMYVVKNPVYENSVKCESKEEYQELLDEMNNMGYDILGLEIIN